MGSGDVFRQLALDAHAMVRDGYANPAAMLEYAADLERFARLIEPAGSRETPIQPFLEPASLAVKRPVHRARPSSVPRQSRAEPGRTLAHCCKAASFLGSPSPVTGGRGCDGPV